MARWRKLGIIAGGGPLPVLLASAASGAFVIRLAGCAEPALEAFDGEECGIGEVGKILGLLTKNGCDAVALAGLVARPDFSRLKLDGRGAALLPRVALAAAKGDGAILGALVETLAAEGFCVVGAEEVLTELTAKQGPLGARSPDRGHWRDIRKAAALIDALGPFDVGQGAVVAAGLVLAVEAAEGTDALLARCRLLPESVRGGAPPVGVLVKRPKPGQELRVDLPTIGVETVRRAGDAGLAGIAIEAGRALVMDAQAARAEADARNLFVYGFSETELVEHG